MGKVNETPKVERKKISDLKPDPSNANAGTERGLSMLADSLSLVGLARGVFADRNGIILGGNKTQERAVDQGFEDAIIVHTTGKELVVTQRDDLDLLSEDEGEQQKARQAAYYDNRTGQLDLQWNPEQLLADANAGFDFSHLFSENELNALLSGTDGHGISGGGGIEHATLSDRFIVPPFSVLDARQGYWQARKQQWLALGIQSEIGRGINLQDLSPANDEYRYNKDEFFARRNAAPGGSLRDAATLGADGKTVRGDGKGRRINGKLPAAIGGQPLPLDRMANGKSPARTFGQDLMRGEHRVGGKELGATYGAFGKDDEVSRNNLAANPNTRYGAQPPHGATVTQNPDGTRAYRPTENGEGQSGTSIFDPVLCELAYRWFSPPGAAVLDLFAGGSVRGIVAHKLGRQYTGIELRPEQVAANETQAQDITPQSVPHWLEGDALDAAALAPGEYDFLFTCPPYADLEIYSDDPRDISNMEYSAFLDTYRRIISGGCAMLKRDRFACIVVGDVRDKKGLYRNFVSDTISAFQDCGLMLYNEAILVTAVGSLPIRAGKQFSSGRKLGKTHQNVLVFVKGDPKKATQACGEVEVYFPEEYESPVIPTGLAD